MLEDVSGSQVLMLLLCFYIYQVAFMELSGLHGIYEGPQWKQVEILFWAILRYDNVLIICTNSY